MLITILMAVALLFYILLPVVRVGLGFGILFRTKSLYAVFKNQLVRKFALLFGIAYTIFATLAYYLKATEESRKKGTAPPDSLLKDTAHFAAFAFAFNVLGYFLCLGGGLFAGSIVQRISIPNVIIPWLILFVSIGYVAYAWRREYNDHKQSPSAGK